MLADLKTAKKATSWQKLIKIHPFRVPIKVPWGGGLIGNAQKEIKHRSCHYICVLIKVSTTYTVIPNRELQVFDKEICVQGNSNYMLW
jgi:hypothetical protein